jgi:DNA-binding transcriptional MerR regulator
MIQIKEFSTQTGFSIRMLRYLEDVELLIPSRGENNYRYYNKNQIEIAKQIKILQELGFQLKEIKNLKETSTQEHIAILKKILQREIDISEIKSETIPKIRQIIETLKNSGGLIEDHLEVSPTKKMKTMGGDPKFHRTAHSIPTLRTVYEDHLTKNIPIKLIATDLMKFSQYLEEANYTPEVFSIFKESSFCFGNNITSDFLRAYSKSWSSFLKDVAPKLLEDFTKDDVSQLMGIHDIIIRTSFEYENGQEAEFIIPYAPFFYLTK